MIYSDPELFFIIVVIGIMTLFLRAIFLFVVPDIINHPVIRSGMDAVPAGMLVALVVPFTFFVDQHLSIFRIEVFAILVSIPVIYLTKKYSYGLIVATLGYILLQVIFS